MCEGMSRLCLPWAWGLQGSSPCPAPSLRLLGPRAQLPPRLDVRGEEALGPSKCGVRSPGLGCEAGQGRGSPGWAARATAGPKVHVGPLPLPDPGSRGNQYVDCRGPGEGSGPPWATWDCPLTRLCGADHARTVGCPNAWMDHKPAVPAPALASRELAVGREALPASRILQLQKESCF